MSEWQIAGLALGTLLSLFALAGSWKSAYHRKILPHWQAYTVALAIRWFGFLLMAVVLALLPLKTIASPEKADLFLAFALAVLLGLIADVLWHLFRLRKS